MEDLIERVLLGTRWLLLPLYLALLLMMAAIYFAVGREIVHLAGHIGEASEADIVLAVLGTLDLVLLANLLLMVAISSYESFISRIDHGSEGNRPEWLGKLDAGGVKVKVSISVMLISAINLLRLYMASGAESADAQRHLVTMALVHGVFILSALAAAGMDRLGRGSH